METRFKRHTNKAETLIKIIKLKSNQYTIINVKLAIFIPANLTARTQQCAFQGAFENYLANKHVGRKDNFKNYYFPISSNSDRNLVIFDNKM